MKKQTAVEYLIDEMKQRLPYFYAYFMMDMDSVYDKAIAMEKEQIVDAFDNGSEEWTAAEYSDGQHYYNHNFES
jgi:hypothetical protein